MKHLKDLWLALVLITGATSVLLFSDLQQQVGRRASTKAYPSIAIMQITSATMIDDHVKGVMDRLQERGFTAPGNQNIGKFNAHGDYGMASAIAYEIVNGPYDMVITTSTAALQVFSKANASVRKPHIFGGVTDPFGAGVGITGPEPGQRPDHMTGIGTFQPVERAFILARELNPAIKRIGVVWNPGEQNSEACMRIAYDICRQLGIELIEAVATNTSEVPEALQSLTGRHVEAIWIGGDTVAASAISTIIHIARQAGIAVFTNDHTDAAKGALFGLGANYYTVGRFTADMAADILEGANPSSFRIENVVPEQYTLNAEVLAALGNKWSVNAVIQSLLDRQAEQTVYGQRAIDFSTISPGSPLPGTDILKRADRYLNLGSYRGEPASIALINLVENPLLDEACRGVEAGLQESGLVQGRDYVIRYFSAQGEIAMLPQVVDAALRNHPDLIVTVTTPALMAVANRRSSVPIVFTVASDPEKIGIYAAGQPRHFCGIHDLPRMNELLDMAMNYRETLSAVGIVYDPSQLNSMISVELLRDAGKQKNMKVLEATVSSVSELPVATMSLIQRGAGAILLSADNLVITGFLAIHRVAGGAGIPIFTTEPGMVELGATGAIGDDYLEWGKQSGILAAKVLAGVPPGQLPVSATKNPITIAPVIRLANRRGQPPLKIRIVSYSETEFAERTKEGILDGFKRAGMTPGRDYNLRIYNAQGDMSSLTSIMNTVNADKVDILMTISTPALQAALRQAGSHTRIVFSSVADGVLAGAGKSETDHLPNVTGVTTRSPFEGMARLLKETISGIRTAGTLFTPAEVNSVLYTELLREALKQEGIELLSIPVTVSSDVPTAATDLANKNIQAVCQIADNLTRPGFAFIARKAAERNIPVYVFDSDKMQNGATVCLARDYYDAGLESAELAVRILNGEDPARLPFRNTKTEKFLINEQLARQSKLHITDSLRKRATVFVP